MLHRNRTGTRTARFSRWQKLALAIGGIAPIACVALSSARADQVLVYGGYHAQTTDHWCGAASAEMMLDVPAVRSTNPVIDAMLNVGDGSTVGAGDPFATTAGGLVTSRAQAFVYGLNHGVNTVNGVGYFNPYAPFGAGTDSNGLVSGLNLMDNPAVNGLTGPAIGNHAYSGFNLAPTLAGAALATRTMANAMKDYNVPAQAVVESGAHSITVFGVSTNGTPGLNQNYTINGVYIHDPWTGFVYDQAVNHGNLAPLAAGGWGLGWNRYLRYGYDIRPGGVPIQLPNGVVAPVRLGPWFQYFNPSPGQASPTVNAFSFPGMKITVEPQGPELPDTGDPLGTYGLLPGLSELPEINSGTADTDGISDLAADPTLSTEPGLTGGSLDSAHEMMLTEQGDNSGSEGDWLVPYEGAGGVNDVTGALLIDADTGVIDQATWIDPATDGIDHITLDQLDEMMMDQANGLLPNDNVTPEPASMTVMLSIGAFALARRRAR